MLLLQTVATASERLGSAILKRPGHVIAFIGSMLQEVDAEAAHLSVALLVMILSGQVNLQETCTCVRRGPCLLTSLSCLLSLSLSLLSG